MEHSVANSTLTKDETEQQSLLVALQRIQTLENQLQSKNQAIDDLEEELSALKNQMITLRDLYNHTREQNEQQKRINQQHLITIRDKDSRPFSINESTLLKEKENVEKLKTENAILHSSLADITQHSKQLERVVQFLRERAEESHLEAKQLRDEFQTNLELVETLTSQSEAHDQELRMAQQHLGKKMREAAELSDKNDELTQQIQQMRGELAESQNLAIMSQQKLNALQIREKNLQDQLLSREQEIENLNQSWEGKYSQVYDKWQETENYYKHLKSLEDKYHQAQSAVSSLYTLFGSSQPTPSNSATASIKHPTKPHFDDHRHSITLVEAIHATPQTKQEKPNLFESSVSPIRYKQTLFD